MEEIKQKRTIKSAGLMLVGILITPIIFVAFIMDRFVMIFMVMGNGPDIVEYFQDLKYVGISLLRSFMLCLIVSFIWWICN